MAKLSVLLFSRNDISQAVGLINNMYDLADDILLIDSSDEANRKKLKEATTGMEKLRVVYVVAFGYPDPMFMYGVKNCRYDWILRLDMDERLTITFESELKKIINKANCSAFAIKRYEEVSDGSKTDFFTWQIRLFKKDKVTFKGLIHEQPEVNGKLQQLEGEELYISHVVELMHHETNQYNKMERYGRYTYRLYNKKVLDYISKLKMGTDRDASKASSGRLIMALLFIYEKITFRNMDKEVSNFDYFMLQFARNLTYQAKGRRGLGGIGKAYGYTKEYMEDLKKLRAGPDSEEDFEIAKIINEIGIIKFLDLENDKRIAEINRRYKSQKQGITLMFKILKDRYAEIKLNKRSYNR